MNYGPIKISLNLDKLKAINESLATLGHEPIDDRAQRVFRAVLNELGIKLMKKQLDVFPKKADFNFKLKYYEADVLQQWILFYLQNEAQGHYEHHLMQTVADEIDQKLA